MDIDNSYDCFDAYAERLIRRKARQLVGKYGFTISDIKDIEQKLALALLQQLPNYDPTRASRRTFINRIINFEIATIIEGRKAKKRDYRLNAGSLNEDYKNDDGAITSRLELVDAEACYRRLGWTCGPSEEQRDLKIDLDWLIVNLPPEIRELCMRLQYQTVLEISQATGVPRSTLYDRMKRVGILFKDKGLKEYS